MRTLALTLNLNITLQVNQTLTHATNPNQAQSTEAVEYIDCISADT